MDRNKIRAALGRRKVGIAGAGGLGSNCAVSLARAGVGSLAVADFDVVSQANLDRQAYFLRQVGMPKVLALAENIRLIDPSVRVEAKILRLDAATIGEAFADCDLLIEALDDAAAKEELIETALALWPRRQLVAASGLAGIGNLRSLKVLRRGTLTLCGDFENEVSDSLPPFAPRVGVVANMEADAALEILLAMEDEAP